MAKISADTSTAQGFTVLAKDNYTAYVEAAEQASTEGGAGTYIKVRWKPDDHKAGEFLGSVFDNVMVSGRSKKGNELRTDRLCDYINALHVEWDCGLCGKTNTGPFVIEGGKYFHPCCGKHGAFTFDPDLWQGKRALIQVDIGKDNKGEDRNEVGKVRPIA
jgi:hypothetical protein